MIDDKLFSLLKVYDLGSFSAAAKQLSLTQPAVSQHIRALEKELGIRIFERTNGKIIVTREGYKVIQCARKMVGLNDLLRQELSDGLHKKDHLVVGVTHTAESNPIAEALARYSAENNGINIKIITDTINNLYKKLGNYELDMAVVEGRNQQEGLRFLLIDTDYLVLAVSPEHPLAGKNMVTMNELKRERLILRLPNSGTRNLISAHLESNNMSIGDLNVILEVDNVATIKDLIRRNFGVSILPRSACLDEIKKKKISVLLIENLSMIREMNIAYRSDFAESDVLKGIAAAYNDTIRSYR